jgi:hypothetical protein
MLELPRAAPAPGAARRIVPDPVTAPGPVTAPQPAVDPRPYAGTGRVAQQRQLPPRWSEDGYDDSVGYDGDEYDPDEYDGDEPAPRPARTRWGRLVLLALLALVLGTSLGVGGSWLIGRLRTDTTSPYQLVPTFAGVLPTAAGTQRIDPALAPVVTTLTDRGSSVVLVWTDPSVGAATFLVLSVDGARSNLLLQISPGTTTATVTGLDPEAPRYCFEVVAFVGDSAGPSALACTPQR